MLRAETAVKNLFDVAHNADLFLAIFRWRLASAFKSKSLFGVFDGLGGCVTLFIDDNKPVLPAPNINAVANIKFVFLLTSFIIYLSHP